MKIEWIESYKKPCWEVRTSKNFPIARIIKDEDIPDLMKYDSYPVKSGYVFIERNWIYKTVP